MDQEGNQAHGISQVFKNKEIWGIDAFTINKAKLKELGDLDFGFISPTLIEEELTHALAIYMKFATEILEVPLPWKFMVGMTRIKGYQLGAPRGMNFGGLRTFAGEVVDDEIIYQGMIHTYEEPTTKLLRPFFEKLWEEAGLERPDKERL